MKRYAKRLGILGGMGPEATAALYLHIVKQCQEKLGAMYNSDFPHIVINSAPVPDGKMWRGFDQKEVERFLRANCRLLQAAKADFIAIPCNSVHGFIDVMRDSVRIPVLSIIEETAKAIRRQRLGAVALFATHFTVGTRAYERQLQAYGIRLITPTPAEQKIVDRIIVNVESGKRTKRDRDTLLRMGEGLKGRGAEGIILGCTEIPLLLRQSDTNAPLFDTLEILAQSAYDTLTASKPR